jgi:primosomal protein N' (replication factor Y)
VNEPTFKGKLSQVIEIVSPIPVLQPHIYELLQAIAARQCCSVGELLPNAIPKRSVRVEKSFSANPPSDKHVVSGSRIL